MIFAECVFIVQLSVKVERIIGSATDARLRDIFTAAAVQTFQRIFSRIIRRPAFGVYPIPVRIEPTGIRRFGPRLPVHQCDNFQSFRYEIKVLINVNGSIQHAVIYFLIASQHILVRVGIQGSTAQYSITILNVPVIGFRRKVSRKSDRIIVENLIEDVRH